MTLDKFIKTIKATHPALKVIFDGYWESYKFAELASKFCRVTIYYSPELNRFAIRNTTCLYDINGPIPKTKEQLYNPARPRDIREAANAAIIGEQCLPLNNNALAEYDNEQ